MKKFVYWGLLPFEIQQLILSYFKFDAKICFKFMEVSRSFKKHVEVMHSEIYDLSLGLCSKKHWSNKVLPAYNELMYSIDIFSRSFKELDALKLMGNGTLFKTFLHFFLCERWCDDVKDYCSLCSHVRPRNFSNFTLFDDVYLEDRGFKSQLGLDNKTVAFEVYLRDSMIRQSMDDGFCLREFPIDHPSDIFILFVSSFMRINLNLCYNFFFKKQVPILTERYYVRTIENFVRGLGLQIWHLNVNYFFTIFEKFEALNRSTCFYIPMNLVNPGQTRLENYFSKLPVVSLPEITNTSDKEKLAADLKCIEY